MQYYESLYEFNILVNYYKNKDINSFNQKFNDFFNATSKMATEQLEIIEELISESVSTHEYVTQILLDNVKQIKANPAKTGVKNLISELDFAQFAYKDSFEKNAEEIDDIEILLIQWNRLLRLNKKLSIFMFSQPSFAETQPIIEKLIIAKDIMTDNINILNKPFKILCSRQEESLSFYNAICNMNKNANRIHKKY